MQPFASGAIKTRIKPLLFGVSAAGELDKERNSFRNALQKKTPASRLLKWLSRNDQNWLRSVDRSHAGAIAGCGSRDQQGQAGVDKSAYKLIVEQRKTAYRQTSQARQATTKDKFVSPRRVKNRGPSGS